MRIQTPLSLSALRRALDEGQVVRRLGDTVQFYVFRPGRRELTPARWESQLAMTAAAGLWEDFSPERRQAWIDYARRHKRLLRGEGKMTAPAGRQLYTAAACRLLELGLDPDVPPPTLLPPLPLTDLRLEPSAGGPPDEFRFTVDHALAPAAGAGGAGGADDGDGAGSAPDHLVTVRITPATRGAGRAPEEQNSRLICGRSMESARPLPPSGATLVFTGARFAVGPGRRFGVWARVLRVSDGLTSPALMRDFERS